MPNVVFREDRLDCGRSATRFVQHFRLLYAALDDLRQRARHPELNVDGMLKMKVGDGYGKTGSSQLARVSRFWVLQGTQKAKMRFTQGEFP